MKLRTIFFFFAFFLVFLFWALYRLYSNSLITYLFHGHLLFGWNPISGSQHWPLAHYVNTADNFFIRLFIGLIILIITLLLFLPALTKSKKKQAIRLYSDNKSNSKNQKASPAKPRISNRLFAKISLLAFTLLVIFTAWLIRYRHFLRNLDGYDNITSSSHTLDSPLLSRQQSINIGWSHNAPTTIGTPENSYLNFSKVKRPEEIRIGVFGDSFTHGCEAEKGHEFPSFLQKRFDVAGLNNVKIINFGVGAYGLHQSYLMWKYIGRHYNLDHVIITPFIGWAQNRDHTFLFGSDYSSFHARFVIKNKSLKLLSPLGSTREEIASNYYGFPFRLRYLRYDNKLNPWARALLPTTKAFANPFYYRNAKDSYRETSDVYPLLFSQWAKEASSLIIAANDDAIYKMRANNLSSECIWFRSGIRELFREKDNFVYKAPMGHLSALGNQVRADEIFAFLTGEDVLSYLKLEVLNKKKSEINQFENISPLHHYKQISLGIEGKEFATFVRPTAKHIPDRFDKGVDFYNEKIAGILNFPAINSGVFSLPTTKEKRFLATSFRFENKDSVHLTFRQNGNVARVLTGSIDANSSVYGKLILPDLPIEGPDWKLTLHGHGNSLIGILSETGGGLKEINITTSKGVLLKGRRQPSLRSLLKKVLLGRTQKTFSFEPTQPLLHLRVTEGQFPELDLLKSREGNVELLLRKENGKNIKAPTHLRYRVKPAYRKFLNHLTSPLLTLKESTNPDFQSHSK